MKISHHDRDTPSFKQSDIYFALTINSGDTASRTFWTNSLLVTPLLNHVNAKIKLNPTPFLADQAPGTLHPNAFKTSNKTNVLCLHLYRRDITGETASGLNIKVFGGFNDSLNLSTGFAARTEQQLLVWGWASAWWGRVSEHAGAWSCIIARFVI